MYRAFEFSRFDYPEGSRDKGLKINEANAKKVRDSLGRFVASGEINGSQLRDHWFPEIKANIFISHSHDDEGLALDLAGWLSNSFGLTSFIDSCVWGHADELLRQIDNKLCLNKNEQTYDYEKRNGTTSHVHMMLATALSRMIDSTECVIFVSSPSSVKAEEAISKVYSPWIYYELAMMEVIRKRDPLEHRPIIKEASEGGIRNYSKPIQIFYEADFKSLTSINLDTLKSWLKRWESDKLRRKHPLDSLYAVAPHQQII